MADKILRRTSYGGEQTDKLEQKAMQKDHVASSEPKLFRKNTVFNKNRRQRQTVKASFDHGGNSDSASNSGNKEKSRLHRQKAQSRKTFKFRKTRKDVRIFKAQKPKGIIDLSFMCFFPFKVRKLKTMTETIGAGNNESAVLEQIHSQQQAPNLAGTGAAANQPVVLNPAIHSAAGNVCRRFTSSTTSTSSSASTLKQKPPKKVQGPTKQDSTTSSTNSTMTGIGGSVFSLHQTSKREVTFPGIEVYPALEHPVLCREQAFDDDGSISSRGTSSTVGYR